MEEENQAQHVTTKEPQQEPKEPQRVTTKDPKKVEAGKRLAAINHKKREEQAQLERTTSGVNQYYGMESLCYSSSGSDRWPWLLHLSNQERRAGRRATFTPTTK